MKHFAKLICAILAVVMVLSLGGCNSAVTPGNKSTASKETHWEAPAEIFNSDANDKEENGLSFDEPTEDNPVQVEKASLYKSIQKYSSDGILRQEIECNFDKDSSTLTCITVGSGEKYILTFDKNGGIAEEKSINSSGSPISWVVYDKVGNRITDLTYNKDGTIYMGYQSELDENGNLVKTINQSSDGSYWIYEYDSRGNESKSSLYDKDGIINKYILYSYEYDQKGNIIVELLNYSDGGSLRHEYEYDSNGNRTKDTSYDNDGQLKSWYDYAYDSYGNRIRSSEYRVQNGQVEPGLTYTYEYNSNAVRIKDAAYRSDGTLNYENEYSDNGTILRMRYYDDAGNISSSYEYEYNEKGQIERVLSCSNGEIIYSATYEYGYDMSGNIIAITCTDDISRTKELVEFYYDNDWNLTKSKNTNANGNYVITEYQTVDFEKKDDQKRPKTTSYYNQLTEYDIPVDTSTDIMWD